MIPGETIASGAPRTCPRCGATPEIQVLCTNAWYIGTWCNCGPYTRESGYYATEEEAQAALECGGYER
jgi:hypothetical protein